jgi:CheY-like chemotaxis protein
LFLVLRHPLRDAPGRSAERERECLGTRIERLDFASASNAKGAPMVQSALLHDGVGANRCGHPRDERHQGMMEDQRPTGVSSSMDPHGLISVVDDDESIRESLPDLLRELGFSAQAFASAEDFLASLLLCQTRLLLLDVAMPNMSGPALQRELARQRRMIPIVFITAQPEDELRRQLLETGTVNVLYKPFSESTLIRMLTAALGAP